MNNLVNALRGLNLPNKLTLLRIALVPVYLLLMWLGQGAFAANVAALAVFACASLTDLFDGRIARSRGLVTNFGKFMDPIADKLLTVTAFIVMVDLERMSAWMCVVFVARECVVSGLRLVAVEQGRVIAAGLSGKVKTVLQMAAVMLLTLDLPALSAVTALVLWAAVAMTVYSMAAYLWQNRAGLHERDASHA